MSRARDVDVTRRKRRQGRAGVLAGDELMTGRDVVKAGSVSGPPQPPAPPLAPVATGTRLAWLDVLRGLAALAVLFDHISYYALQHVRSLVYHW